MARKQTSPLYQYHTDKRPNVREKLFSYGAPALSDQELIMAMLGSGTKKTPVYTLAKTILPFIYKQNNTISVNAVKNIQGMGSAKTASLLASLELGRRVYIPRKCVIKSPDDVYPFLIHYTDTDQEQFIVISLNGAHEIIKKRVVTVGLINRTLVHPREVFIGPLMDKATSIIIAHNHPSGNLTPSAEDIKVTDLLINAGKILGIFILDHIIFSSDTFFSMKKTDSIAF